MERYFLIAIDDDKLATILINKYYSDGATNLYNKCIELTNNKNYENLRSIAATLADSEIWQQNNDRYFKLRNSISTIKTTIGEI